MLTHAGKMHDDSRRPQRHEIRRESGLNGSGRLMESHMTINGFAALYIFMLAAFAGWVIIGNVPAILHTPLMSGSNFVHGIVVVGGLFALLNASERRWNSRSASSRCCSARATPPADMPSPSACSKCSSPATRRSRITRSAGARSAT